MANKRSSSEKGKKRYTFQFSLISLLLSCIGFIFILGWVFALGIMVGRGFLPGSIDAFSLFKKKAVKDVDKKKANHTPLIKEEELSFYNQLIDKKDRAKKKVPPQSLLKDQVRPIKKLRIQQRKEKVGKYSVQVAALKDRRKTEKMVERLIRSGYPAFYYETIINGEVYYRIRCGPFPTITQAKQYVKLLFDKEGFKPFIVYPHNK